MLVAEHLPALALSAAVAAIYLLVVRFLDVNEREPLWSVAALFVLGLAAASALPRLVPSTVLELDLIRGTLAREVAIFAAILAGLAVLTAAARRRGWSEFDGTADGIVYGAAAGLGFATGEAWLRELTVQSAVVATPGFATTLWSTALAGLAYAVFGAVLGIGLAAASQARSVARRVAWAGGALVAAILAHAGHEVLAHGNALGGAVGLVRAWVALLVPLPIIAAVGRYALWRERAAIEGELTEERAAGIVTDGELRLLQNVPRRQLLYLSTAARGRFGRCARLMALHNRQVQLALAKRRAARADAARRRERLAEIDALRAAVLDVRRRLE